MKMKMIKLIELIELKLKEELYLTLFDNVHIVRYLVFCDDVFKLEFNSISYNNKIVFTQNVDEQLLHTNLRKKLKNDKNNQIEFEIGIFVPDKIKDIQTELQKETRLLKIKELYESDLILKLVIEREKLNRYTMIYTNHSGGAKGSDHQWQIIGENFGFDNHKHYWYQKITPYGNCEISEEDAIEGQIKATIAARQMGRIQETFQIRNHLIIRNWCQVKYSDSIYAISYIIPKNGMLEHEKIALIHQVAGGTGYAVQMAINENKPVYVFDQNKNKWYSCINNVWSACKVPILTENYAGIGTREINSFGLKAIEDVYDKTLE